MSLEFLMSRTERVVETAFLWLRILKTLKHGPKYMSELRRSLNPVPHMYTFQLNLYLMERLGLVAKEKRGRLSVYRITPKGIMVLERATNHLKKHVEYLLDGRES